MSTNTTPSPYQLTITLDTSTRDNLKVGNYALHLGRLADITDITDPELNNSQVLSLSNLADSITINQEWTAPTGGVAPDYMISYSTDFIPDVKQLPADVVIPRMVAAAPGEAFALLTKGDSLVKIDPTPSWVRPGTIGFKNSTPAQPLLYGNATTPIFGASSLWIPGQGRVKPPVEDRVYAWFANAKSDDIGGFETEDVSSVVELKFRRGKKTLIRYEDSNPDGWFEQRLVDIEPLP